MVVMVAVVMMAAVAAGATAVKAVARQQCLIRCRQVVCLILSAAN
jgi:hypothetical protein